MGVPAKLPAKFIDIRIKGKSREADLSKIGITGRVRLDIVGSRGNRVIVIERLENQVDNAEVTGNNDP